MSPDNALTPRQRRLFDVLKAEGDWMSREGIAHGLGVTQLLLKDVYTLKWMTARGLIETRKGRSEANYPRYEYRVKPEAANGV